MSESTLSSRPGTGSVGLAARARALNPAVSDGVRQFWLLMHRCWDGKKSDQSNLWTSALQVPMIGALLILAFYGNETNTGALMFCLTVSALWFGVFASIREIVSEYGVYRRERLLGLGIAPYVASKIPVLFAITSVQVTILLAVVYPILLADSEAGLGGIFVVLVLTAAGGVGLGLMLSALALILGRTTANRAGSVSSEVAMSLVPIALLPQIVLGGPFFVYDKALLATRLASKLTLARWSLSAILNLEETGPQTVARQLGMRGDSVALSCFVIAGLFLLYTLAAACLLKHIDRSG